MNQPTPAAVPASGADAGPYPGASPLTPEQAAYQRARSAVRALRRWYLHLAVYLTVNFLIWTKFLFLGASNWGPRHHGFDWPFGPTVLWGIGLLIHGLFVWSRVSGRGAAWEDRKVRQYLDRD